VPQKRTEHSINPNDVEIGPFQLQRMFGESYEGDIDVYLNSIYCDCEAPTKRLTKYKSYLNTLNDVVLKGTCSGCGDIAVRYIETGERKGIDKIGNKIRSLNKN